VLLAMRLLALSMLALDVCHVVPHQR
jgi:hypothetical protein